MAELRAEMAASLKATRAELGGKVDQLSAQVDAVQQSIQQLLSMAAQSGQLGVAVPPP